VLQNHPAVCSESGDCEAMNHLYYGDNLDVLRRYIDHESVDLIYLDPPFKSNQDYNVLFAEHNGTRSSAQIKAFEDTWRWDQAAAAAYQETVEAGGKVSEVMQSFRLFLGDSDMLAYLCMMAPRLVELRRVLKPTGTIYLHCDPTASHYLKLLMDAVFGPKRFLNEVSWKRSSAHSDTKQGMRRFGRVHDVLLVYRKGQDYTWNVLFTPYTEEYLRREYRHKTHDSRYYKETDVTAARPGGDTQYEWRVKRRAAPGERWEADLEDEYLNTKPGYEYAGVRPYEGRFWAYSKANMVEFAKAGKLIHRRTGMPRLIQFADEMPGIPLQDLWDDIQPALGSEDLGYPTQKPEALLERIIRTSSNEGDTVLDPFCGCGTAVIVAERLRRKWIGIDISHLAIGLIKSRLQDAFGREVHYQTIGEPTTVSGARALAQEDPYQFQWWALGLVGARRVEQKRGPDKGIDGRLYFHDEGPKKTKQAIFSVKAGKLHAHYVRDLRGVIEREKAQIGVLLTLEEPTKKMKAEAASADFYESPWGKHPRLQIITVGELLEGKEVDMPPVSHTNVTFKRAPRAERKQGEQLTIGEAVDEGAAVDED